MTSSVAATFAVTSIPTGWPGWSDPCSSRSTAGGQSMPEARVIPLDGSSAPARGEARRTERCAAVEATGQQCSAKAVADGLCGTHLAERERAEAVAAAPEWERKAGGPPAFVRRRGAGDQPAGRLR